MKEKGKRQENNRKYRKLQKTRNCGKIISDKKKKRKMIENLQEVIEKGENIEKLQK